MREKCRCYVDSTYEPDGKTPSCERRGAVQGGDRGARTVPRRRRPRAGRPARGGHVLVPLPGAVPRRPEPDRGTAASAQDEHSNEHSLEHEIVFAQLGGAATSIASEVADVGGVVAVTDGTGRILTVQGDPKTLARARDSNMAPWSCWSERATGTNGMGTALEAPGPVLICGPEHWCIGLHEWVCAGVAVRDAVTHEPVAVLDVSTWRHNLPAQAAGWLSKAVGGARAILRQRAHDSGAELAAAFTQTRAHSEQGLAALDASGRVVIADEGASLLLGVPSRVPALDPTVRWKPSLDFGNLARHAIKQARLDHDWVGSTQIVPELGGEPCRITMRPVFLADQPIGTLAVFGSEYGDPLESPRPQPGPGLSPRVVAMSGESMVLLRRGEVQFAEADGNDVWLVTDEGRLQARCAASTSSRWNSRAGSSCASTGASWSTSPASARSIGGRGARCR